MTRPDFVFEEVDSTFVLLHSRAAPADPEWNRYLDRFVARGERLASCGVLVFSDGGGPTSEQRRRMNQITAGRAIRTAIVSDAATVRFIVSTLALFNEAIRSFDVRALPAALAHVGADGERERGVRALLAELRRGDPEARFASLARAVG